jgi:hypothetical protein
LTTGFFSQAPDNSTRLGQRTVQPEEERHIVSHRIRHGTPVYNEIVVSGGSRGGAGNAMSELQDAGRMLAEAEQAAIANDLVFAYELLRGAARIQEAELGPLHPDLANTLNNLAIVAEKTGRLGDAETFYRRAVAIASASLPVDHPMIAASRENLEDFCRARGLPIDTPAFMTLPARDTAAGLDASAPESAGGASATPGDVRTAEAGLSMEAAPPLSGSPWPVSRQRTPTASQPLSPVPRPDSRSVAWAAIGVVVVLITAMFFVRRPWSSRETSTTAPPAEPTTRPQAAERALPPRAEPPGVPAIEQARPPIVPRRDDGDVLIVTPTAPTPSSGAATLATAQLCRNFSTSGASWQCDPAVDPVSPGRLVLYTRVKSPRDAVVVHRWYRGDTLQQSVQLAIRANATDGYRTYSRQTVDGGADWRVEVSSANGDLLHERRFAVR